MKYKVWVPKFIMEERQTVTYQGREQTVEQYNQDTFNSFIDSISGKEEWKKWKFMVEGDLITDSTNLLEAMSALSKRNVLMIDHNQRIIHFMNRETYELNLDS